MVVMNNAGDLLSALRDSHVKEANSKLAPPSRISKFIGDISRDIKANGLYDEYYEESEENGDNEDLQTQKR